MLHISLPSSPLILCCSPHLEVVPFPTLLSKLSTLHCSSSSRITLAHTASCLEIPPTKAAIPISEVFSTPYISKCFVYATNTHQAEIVSSPQPLSLPLPIFTNWSDSTELQNGVFLSCFHAFLMLLPLYGCLYLSFQVGKLVALMTHIKCPFQFNFLISPSWVKWFFFYFYSP